MSTRRWRILLWVAMLLVVGWLAWQARGALIPFAIGAVLAYALSPLVDVLASAIPARSHRGDVYRRGAAVLTIYLLFVLGVVGAGVMLIPAAVGQVAEFIDTLPDTAEAAREQVTLWFDEYRSRVPPDVQERIDSLGEDAALAVANAAAVMMERSFGLLTGTLTFVFGIVIVPFFMFYAMRDRHFVGNNFSNAVPSPVRADVLNMRSIADTLLGRYVRAQLFLGLVVGVVVGIGLTLMDVQLSLALGLFAGITELIPIIGPWIGAVPALIIVAATDPGLFLWVALLFVAVQQVENLLLVPRIQGQAVKLHPAMIILLLAVAGAVFGFIGLLFIVPLAAILREIFWYVDHRLSGATPEEALSNSHVGHPEGPPATEPTPESEPDAEQATPSTTAVDAGERPRAAVEREGAPGGRGR